MSLNDSMSEYERSQLAVWDYPVSDKYTKMWQAMAENTPPKTFEEAVERVRGKHSNGTDKETDGFAFLGKYFCNPSPSLLHCFKLDPHLKSGNRNRRGYKH